MARESRPIHVLMLTDTLMLGGAEQLVVRLSQMLDPRRFRRTVCVTRPVSVFDPNNEWGARGQIQAMRAAGVTVLELPRRYGPDLSAWRPLVRFLRAEQVDVLHAHKFGSNFWGSVLGTISRVPVILSHEHTWSFEGQPVRRLVDRWIVARLSDLVIAVSEADRRRMTEIVGIPPERIVLIPNGIPELPAGDGSAIRHEFEIAADAPVLASVANLRPQKAFDVMIRALADVHKDFPGVRLLIAGGGDRSSLEMLAAELGVANAVRFLGLRTDIENVLAAADIAVSSSDFEGSPLAGMEYLAAGLPIVATAVGGMPDLVHPGVNGALVPRRDPPALARAITELLSDLPRARELGQCGRELQRREFSLDVMTRRLEKLYEERLRLSRRARRSTG